LEPDDPLSAIFAEIIIQPLSPVIVIGLLVILILLISSALISGSEIAFFSMSPREIETIKKKQSKKNGNILLLLEKPEKLLATILISNNFVNVGIVMLTSYVMNSLFDFSQNELTGFIVQVIFITFLILLFGEIIPKVYASEAGIRFARMTAGGLLFAFKLFSPISNLLVSSTRLVNRRLKSKHNISIEELSHAYELTHTDIKEDKNILEGIVNFGFIEVKEILKPRVDVIAAEISYGYNKVRSLITEHGYSRIPVYEETFDKIKGILYVKDLLEYHTEADDFEWTKFIRPPYFVPENMKINGLLHEFQTKKMHMALVSDEYGGVAGIVTLEDVLEEIVGDINDETDRERSLYTIISKTEFLLDGKILINDLYKITGEEDVFEDLRGEADSVAGLILEIKGEIPKKDEIIRIKDYVFKITSADNRKIKQMQLKIDRKK